MGYCKFSADAIKDKSSPRSCESDSTTLAEMYAEGIRCNQQTVTQEEVHTATDIIV